MPQLGNQRINAHSIGNKKMHNYKTSRITYMHGNFEKWNFEDQKNILLRSRQSKNNCTILHMY